MRAYPSLTFGLIALIASAGCTKKEADSQAGHSVEPAAPSAPMTQAKPEAAPKADATPMAEKQAAPSATPPLATAPATMTPAATAPTEVAHVAAVPPPPAAKPELELAKRSGCLACHSVEKKVVGPAWNEVSKRYVGDATAKSKLLEKIKKGGKGNWLEVTGGATMPPYSPRVSDADIATLVDFVLGLQGKK